MHFSKEAGDRFKAERERIGLTVAQVAAFMGLMPQIVADLESGKRAISIEFACRAHEFGADPRFIAEGVRSDDVGDDMPLNCDQLSPIQDFSLDSREDAFNSALKLMRRSIASVDAFLGEGSSKSSPDLVVALMKSTIGYEHDRSLLSIAESISESQGGGESSEVIGSLIESIEALEETIDGGLGNIAEQIGIVGESLGGVDEDLHDLVANQAANLNDLIKVMHHVLAEVLQRGGVNPPARKTGSPR